MSYNNIREEELKNKIAQDYFGEFDCTKIIGNLDFCVTIPAKNKEQESLFETESLLWAEAKKGKTDFYYSIVQLILTIGKARTFDKSLPPAFLGAFDAEKIVFIAYNDIHDIFYINDFNWNVAPSNHDTKEFIQIHDKVKTTIENSSLVFDFGNDNKELKEFIKINFVSGKSSTSKIKIDKNNFMVIYNKWLSIVKPTIAVTSWDIAKRSGIIDGDFYFADLLSIENESIKNKLSILLQSDHYILKEKADELGELFRNIQFSDKQKAHTQFWNKYERPPQEEYWDYIVERRDLLVPQDIRERKGSFFTPQNWVELSQKYIAEVLGIDWQDDYYIWDCAAGTGNLLAGLTNRYNIWASTLDQQDVDVMHDRIETMNKNSISGIGGNILHNHVFQFDFLNDDFSKLPIRLQDIINNPKKRKKLVIYINPPYAEVSSKAIKGKVGVNLTKMHSKYLPVLGTAGRELYAQFFVRIYGEIQGCILAEFSTLKTLQGSAFDNFRHFFEAKLEKCFVAPADTFDNVKGQFPIGFKIWNTGTKDKFDKIDSDVYDDNGEYIGYKTFYTQIKSDYINKWISKYKYKTKPKNAIGFMDGINGNDFQHNNIVYILNSKEQLPNPRGIWINGDNLIPVSIYIAVRKCIDANWLNDRDQFLYPNKKWEKDTDFQNDCLAYTLFNNNIQSQYGTNYWIPFTEYEIGSPDNFDSHFMTDFIAGKKDKNIVSEPSLFDKSKPNRTTPLKFSAEANAVFAAGKALWKYYHQQKDCNVNASLYDIREHFQGRNDKGKMNNKSEDKNYTKSITDLRDKLKVLAKKIEPKVYEYEFLKS